MALGVCSMAVILKTGKRGVHAKKQCPGTRLFYPAFVHRKAAFGSPAGCRPMPENDLALRLHWRNVIAPLLSKVREAAMSEWLRRGAISLLLSTLLTSVIFLPLLLFANLERQCEQSTRLIVRLLRLFAASPRAWVI
jgi:hypothetical protein